MHGRAFAEKFTSRFPTPFYPKGGVQEVTLGWSLCPKSSNWWRRPATSSKEFKTANDTRVIPPVDLTAPSCRVLRGNFPPPSTGALTIHRLSRHGMRIPGAHRTLALLAPIPIPTLIVPVLGLPRPALPVGVLVTLGALRTPVAICMTVPPFGIDFLIQLLHELLLAALHVLPSPNTGKNSVTKRLG